MGLSCPSSKTRGSLTVDFLRCSKWQAGYSEIFEKSTILVGARLMPFLLFLRKLNWQGSLPFENGGGGAGGRRRRGKREKTFWQPRPSWWVDGVSGLSSGEAQRTADRFGPSPLDSFSTLSSLGLVISCQKNASLLLSFGRVCRTRAQLV